MCKRIPQQTHSRPHEQKKKKKAQTGKKKVTIKRSTHVSDNAPLVRDDMSGINTESTPSTPAREASTIGTATGVCVVSAHHVVLVIRLDDDMNILVHFLLRRKGTSEHYSATNRQREGHTQSNAYAPPIGAGRAGFLGHDTERLRRVSQGIGHDRT